MNEIRDMFAQIMQQKGEKDRSKHDKRSYGRKEHYKELKVDIPLLYGNKILKNVQIYEG